MPDEELEQALRALAERSLTTAQRTAILRALAPSLSSWQTRTEDNVHAFIVWLLDDEVRIASLLRSPPGSLVQYLRTSFSRALHEMDSTTSIGRIRKALDRVLAEDGRFSVRAKIISVRNGECASPPSSIWIPGSERLDHRALADAAVNVVASADRDLTRGLLAARLLENYKPHAEQSNPETPESVVGINRNLDKLRDALDDHKRSFLELMLEGSTPLEIGEELGLQKSRTYEMYAELRGRLESVISQHRARRPMDDLTEDDIEFLLRSILSELTDSRPPT